VPETLFDRRFGSLLEDLAVPPPGPSGGVAAAAALSMAAALVAMVARTSTASWPEAAGVVAQADRLQARAAKLADEGAAAFAAALTALRPPGTTRPDNSQLGDAMNAAVEPPLRIAELAADVALLAALAGRKGDPDVHADAVVAATLAAAAGRAAAHLVEVNLVVTESHAELSRARHAAAAAAAASDEAMASALSPTARRALER
jgi:formiminotetrahydrofolate cyclodeaminase